jgi:hypothetical protein
VSHKPEVDRLAVSCQVFPRAVKVLRLALGRYVWCRETSRTVVAERPSAWSGARPKRGHAAPRRPFATGAQAAGRGGRLRFHGVNPTGRTGTAP